MSSVDIFARLDVTNCNKFPSRPPVIGQESDEKISNTTIMNTELGKFFARLDVSNCNKFPPKNF